MRGRASEGIGHLRRGHARGLRTLRLGRGSLLGRRHASLEGQLLRCLLELLGLLARIARELGLLGLRRRLLEALWLAWVARELLLERSARESSRLGSQGAREAAWLLERRLLAILGLLAGSGAVPTP